MSTKNTLKFLIENIVSRMLEEQENETQEIDFGDSTESDNSGTETTEDSAELDIETSDMSGGTEGGAEELDLDAGDEDLSGDDLGSSAGGGGLNISGGGGGGFDLAGDDESANADNNDEANSTEEEPSVDGLQPGEILIPEDPVETIINQAVDLLNDTNNNQIIYNNVKASIQDYFDDFNDAAPIIQALWETEDLVLRAVARKLLLFIKGI